MLYFKCCSLKCSAWFGKVWICSASMVDLIHKQRASEFNSKTCSSRFHLESHDSAIWSVRVTRDATAMLYSIFTLNSTWWFRSVSETAKNTIHLLFCGRRSRRERQSRAAPIFYPQPLSSNYTAADTRKMNSDWHKNIQLYTSSNQLYHKSKIIKVILEGFWPKTHLKTS